MSDVATSVAGDEAGQRRSLSARQTLNVVTAVIGIPLTWSSLAGMYDIKDYDPLYLVANAYKMGDMVFWAGLAIGAVLAMFDVVLAKADEDFKDELYNLLKDIGEHVKGGLAIEAAVQKSAGWKSTPPAKAFQEALELSKEIPFDHALLKVADDSGQRSFQEVAGLMAMAVGTGGDVGPSLRWLGSHFATLRQNEKRFTASIEGSLKMMRGVGLLAAPFMYYWLEKSLDRFNAEQGPLDPMTVAFFVFGAIGMGSLDGIVYDRWARVPAKLPLFIGLIRLTLGLW